MAEGLPEENPEGAFNILPRESIEKLPRGSIHYYIPKAFPQIVILSRYRTTLPMESLGSIGSIVDIIPHLNFKLEPSIVVQLNLNMR